MARSRGRAAPSGPDADERIATESDDSATVAAANEALPRLSFVHVPKVAGTSITASLESVYGAHMLPAMTTLDYPTFDAGQLEQFRFYKGHAYRRDYERLPRDTRRFTVLRDPVTRALSYRHYYRTLNADEVTDPYVKEAIHLAKTNSAIEFIYSDSPFIIEHLRLGQARQFLSEATLGEVGHRQFLTRDIRQRAVDDFVSCMAGFDFVLTYEALALSFPLMVAKLGLPARCGVLPRENVSVQIDNVDPADVRRAVIDVNAGEFECYEYVRRREMDWLTAELQTRAEQPAVASAH